MSSSAVRPVRVAIVNDYEIVVAGVAAVLAPYQDRIDIIELDSGTPVASDVDVILYDTFGQAQGDAVDVASLARNSARVLIFSWNVEPALVEKALAAGADGYVSKGLTSEGLVEAIEQVHAGETVVPTPDTIGDRFGRWPGEEHGLSPREAEVLALICQGLSNQDIGQRAFIGVNTVKTYVRTLYQKIGATNRAQAVLWGVAHGFQPDRVRRTLDEGAHPNG
ncbi:response regulator transcription factor [Nocardioides sp. BGMRC 2183]|nr:response regulator transcription factor [Nocardioides sp. BGMRC 2183]